MWYVLISTEEGRNWLSCDRPEQVKDAIDRLLKNDVSKSEIIINASCDDTLLCVDDFNALLN